MSAGWTTAPADDVVREVEQPAHEVAVADHARLAHQRAVSRRTGHDEGSLGALGNDDRVLHLLRLDEAQDLDPEILETIAPAQPTARDISHAEVSALGPDAAHPDLVPGPRIGHRLYLTAVELESDRRLGIFQKAGLEVVRAHRGLDQIQQTPQRAVVIDTLYGLERRVEGILYAPSPPDRGRLRDSDRTGWRSTPTGGGPPQGRRPTVV